MGNSKSMEIRLWLSRFLVGAVLLVNLQATLTFIFNPAMHVRGFDMSGALGLAMVRTMGVLFLMWNIPYFFAMINPIKYHISLIEALIMQAIGIVGESYILFLLPKNYVNATSSVERFILFDTLGFVVLLIAFLLIRKFKKMPE